LEDALINSGIPRELIVFIIAMLPVAELRGAIPVGINYFGLTWPVVAALAVGGNMLPIPFILLFFEGVYRLIRRVRIFDRFFHWLFARTRRNSGLIEKYEAIGLLIFVAIPLPLTGAWTGALAAWLMGMRFWPSFLSILGGVAIAGAIVMTLSLLGWVGATIAGVALCAVAAGSIWGAYRRRRQAAT
jgi:uncharacterized membrane protein